MCPPTKSSLNEWLLYIEAIHPTEIELGLSRLQTVASRVIRYETSPFVFTVAGTNGKGTTTAALTVLSMAAGKSVGWYSSPHLQKFNERVQINGEYVSDEALVLAFKVIEQARGDISLSYFEFTTLAALWLFDQAQLDVWVLEVGLGGRLDAVNIVEPDISVITTVGLDHQDFLGSDLDSIGREKAGICRPHRPVVLGSTALPESVNHTITLLKSKPFEYGRHHYVSGKSLVWQGGSMDGSKLTIPLANAVTALQSFWLSPFPLAIDTAAVALNCLRVRGRLQRLEFNGHQVIVDVGHNPHAAQYIASELAGRQYHLIIGMVKGKDATGFIRALSSISTSINLISLKVNRGLSAKQLQEQTGLDNAKLFDSVESAVRYIDQAFPSEAIFIGGSFFTVSDALTALEDGVGS